MLDPPDFLGNVRSHYVFVECLYGQEDSVTCDVESTLTGAVSDGDVEPDLGCVRGFEISAEIDLPVDAVLRPTGRDSSPARPFTESTHGA